MPHDPVDWLSQYSRTAGMAVPWDMCPICAIELRTFLPWQVLGFKGYAVICAACKNIVGYDTSADLMTHAEQAFMPATWWPEDVFPDANHMRTSWLKRVTCSVVGHQWEWRRWEPRSSRDWCLRCHIFRGHVPSQAHG